MRPGILLLSGGSGRRMGMPKHDLAHPAGGSWGAHLIRTFTEVYPEGQRVVLGEAIPGMPELERMDDSRQGPAEALRAWARTRPTGGAPGPTHWWIVGCDQVRWTPARLAEWTSLCQQADPAGAFWVIAEHDGHLQPLGGWFPDALRPELAACEAQSLVGLLKALPHLILPRTGPEWRDVDTPAERLRFEAESSQKP